MDAQLRLVLQYFKLNVLNLKENLPPRGISNRKKTVNTQWQNRSTVKLSVPLLQVKLHGKFPCEIKQVTETLRRVKLLN